MDQGLTPPDFSPRSGEGGRYGPAPSVGAQPGGSGGSGSNFGHGGGTGDQPTLNPGVSNLTQYGNAGWMASDIVHTSIVITLEDRQI